MTRALLAPLELLYSAAIRARNNRYDRTAPQRLGWPVVSVGNLSVGGSGKTPLVIRLAQLFEQSGWSADVLSRGYGRSSNAAERVDASEDAERFGDEPLLIAQAAHVPVFVGAERYEAGQLAEREAAEGGKHVHLLDDGFQHRQLARTADIVLIHPCDLSDRLLPAGRLREPLSSLERADVIVLRKEDAELAAKLEPYIRSGTPVWHVRRSVSAAGGGKRALGFCAIARPGEFYKSLEAAGTELAARMSFRDHHRYTRRDMEELGSLGAQRRCEEFVTTEKDAVKLNHDLRAMLTRIAPLRVAKLSLEIDNERAAMAQLIAMLEQSEISRPSHEKI